MSHTLVEVFRVEPTTALDQITVYWENYEPSKGMVTLVCFGSAWTCWFGGMGGKTIQEFFASADTDYLVSKLGNTPHLFRRKRDLAYLARIIVAVKEAVAKATGGAE